MYIDFSSLPFFSLYSTGLMLILGFLIIEGHYYKKSPEPEWNKYSDIQKLFYYFIVGLVVFTAYSFISFPFVSFTMLTDNPQSAITYYSQQTNVVSDLFNLPASNGILNGYLLSSVFFFLITPAFLLFLVRRTVEKGYILTKNGKYEIIYSIYATLFPALILSILIMAITCVDLSTNTSIGLLKLGLESIASALPYYAIVVGVLAIVYLYYDYKNFPIAFVRLLKALSNEFMAVLSKINGIRKSYVKIPLIILLIPILFFFLLFAITNAAYFLFFIFCFLC